MEIFISWSGVRSGACAKALHAWLPCVMQSVKPWVSAEDIAKGARGGHEIAQKLANANFGIVCLTPSNLHSEWMHFESGALSKHLENSALFTLLFDLQPADVKQPLGSFQHTQSSKEEIRKLIEAINSRNDRALASDVLMKSFEAFWPQLESAFAKLPADPVASSPVRQERELLEEILSIVRGQNQINTKTTELDLAKRRAGILLAFADGLLQGRKNDAGTDIEYSEDEFTLKLQIESTEYSIDLPADKPVAELKKRITDFIVNSTLTDDDIPF